MKQIVIFIFSLFFCNTVFAEEFHVSTKGNDKNPGTKDLPFKTIQAAANKAQAGDVITVHAGVYREWIKPPRGGINDNTRIVYRAAPGEKVEIKGSERITGWMKETKDVWKVVLPNSFFGDYNPYKEILFGDWMVEDGRLNHTGEVFLNGQYFYERDSLSKLMDPEPFVTKAHPKGSMNFWYCESDDDNTTIWVRFGNVDPNKELVEISMRPTCFYPEKQGLDYITIQGFDISQAATRWASPTNEQVGIVSTHWNKGWIIEDNVIHDSKCSGVTLGKERSTGNNILIQNGSNKDPNFGTTLYMELIFNVLRYGWNKENTGSHIVRNNTIFNCEHTAICGMMAAFSEISGNHIYNIYTRQQFYGVDIAGIKFHGAIDVTIKNNRIHDCGSYGIWLDWMAQGARVSANLFYDNQPQDLFIEVSHGPYIIDNNIFLSPHAIREHTDGGAFLYNIISGNISRYDDQRFTPYHLNHSTEIKGIQTITEGDHRFYNNIFIGGNDTTLQYGMVVFDMSKYPIYAENNLFLNGSLPMTNKTEDWVKKTINPNFRLEETANDEVYLISDINLQELSSFKGKSVDTDRLGDTKVSRIPFENPDGSPIEFEKDFLGNDRSAFPIVGPIEKLSSSKRIKVWPGL